MQVGRLSDEIQTKAVEAQVYAQNLSSATEAKLLESFAESEKGLS